MRFVTVRILKFCSDMQGLIPSHPLSHWELNGCLSFWQITRESRRHERDQKRDHKKELTGFIAVWSDWSVTLQRESSGNRRSFLHGSILMIPHGSIVSCRNVDLFWLGSEGHRITFCFESDIDLMQQDSTGNMELNSNGKDHSTVETLHPEIDFLNSLFRDPAARYDFSTLLRLSKSSDIETVRRLWGEVWQGRITNDTFITLRRAIMNRFDLQHMMAENVKRTRNRISRRRRLSLVEEKESHPFVGNWHLISRSELPDDLLETEERRKDRVRLLLDRYGILFRELLQKEWPNSSLVSHFPGFADHGTVRGGDLRHLLSWNPRATVHLSKGFPQTAEEPCRKKRSTGSMQPIRFPCVEFRLIASAERCLQGWQAHTSFTGERSKSRFEAQREGPCISCPLR